MTVPAGSNWCETCQEACHDHASICTVCGTSLGPPPSTSSSNTSIEPRIRAVPENMLTEQLRELLTAGGDGDRDIARELWMLEMLRSTTDRNSEGEWQQVPEALLIPQQSAAPAGRPTSKAVLEQLPRIVLGDETSIFRKGTLKVFAEDDGPDAKGPPVQCEAIPAEFGPTEDFSISQATLVIPSSNRTGAKWDESTLSKLKVSNQESPCILLLQRGGNTTFAQKALAAQDAGATACLIGNHTSSPWPYVMQDSHRLAATQGLRIPVGMVSQGDAKQLVEIWSSSSSAQTLRCALDFENVKPQKDCVVCCETFENGQRLLKLPECRHVFHEDCAMLWLIKHNTCPYCRWELPTDDADYEAERRRQQRTHAGSTSSITNNATAGDVFYG